MKSYSTVASTCFRPFRPLGLIRKGVKKTRFSTGQLDLISQDLIRINVKSTNPTQCSPALGQTWTSKTRTFAIPQQNIVEKNQTLRAKERQMRRSNPQTLRSSKSLKHIIHVTPMDHLTETPSPSEGRQLRGSAAPVRRGGGSGRYMGIMAGSCRAGGKRLGPLDPPHPT